MINPPSIETTGVPLSSGNSFAVKKVSNSITWYAGAKQLFRGEFSEPFLIAHLYRYSCITTLFLGLIFLFMLSSAVYAKSVIPRTILNSTTSILNLCILPTLETDSFEKFYEGI